MFAFRMFSVPALNERATKVPSPHKGKWHRSNYLDTAERVLGTFQSTTTRRMIKVTGPMASASARHRRCISPMRNRECDRCCRTEQQADELRTREISPPARASAARGPTTLLAGLAVSGRLRTNDAEAAAGGGSRGARHCAIADLAGERYLQTGSIVRVPIGKWRRPRETARRRVALSGEIADSISRGDSC